MRALAPGAPCDGEDCGPPRPSRPRRFRGGRGPPSLTPSRPEAERAAPQGRRRRARRQVRRVGRTTEIRMRPGRPRIGAREATRHRGRTQQGRRGRVGDAGNRVLEAIRAAHRRCARALVVDAGTMGMARFAATLGQGGTGHGPSQDEQAGDELVPEHAHRNQGRAKAG